MKKTLFHTLLFVSLAIFISAQDNSLIDAKAMQELGIFKLKTINTKSSEFAPAFFNEGIIFVGMPAELQSGFLKKKKSYYNLYYAPVNAFGIPKALPEEISFLNTPFHEGPVSYHPLSETLYFTRTNANDWKTVADNDSEVNLQIFFSEFIDGKWGTAKKLTINSDTFSVCHPSINKEGARLFFASNMEGGFGGMDIYYCEKDGDSWGAPVNLGPEINTIANDWFPFIHDSGRLFFCSDGHEGFGGLDIFVSENLDGNFSAPENLGKKINNAFDQAGFVLSDNGKRGYFASEDSLKGNDDLFLFDSKYSLLISATNTEPANLECLVQIRKKNSLRGLAEFDIKVFDMQLYKSDFDNALLGEQQSDLNGYTAFTFLAGQKLLFQAEKDGELVGEWVKTAGELIRLDLEPKSNAFANENTITTNIRTATITSGAVISLDNIYYDYNKAEIKPGAAEELEILAKIMQDYPVITIILTAHTDSRGTEIFNQKLSEERAASAKNYLLKKGIDESRISILGMGESRLRNHCSDGVECSEEEHQFNRRTEVRIVTAPAGIEIKYQ